MVRCHQESPQRSQCQWSGTVATPVSQCPLLVAQAHIQMVDSSLSLEQEPMREELH